MGSRSIVDEQRDAIRTFCELIQTSEWIANEYLKRVDYRVEAAIEHYYQDSHPLGDSGVNEAVPGVESRQQESIEERRVNQEEDEGRVENASESGQYSINHSLDGPSTTSSKQPSSSSASYDESGWGRRPTRRASVSPSPRSPSPDYWQMADLHQRGTKQWLRTEILSVLNAYSTVNEEDKTLKMVTVAHLSMVLRSFDEGKKSTREDHYTDKIDILGYRENISWLDFLREMRDEGLLRIHTVDVGNLKDFALYAPSNRTVSSLASEREYID
ncbi:hypothetical protein PMAYCL1PPCAC_31511 [Pristionchus mayeri]|uniref:Uncharacterized protein n=1 Tax=Pristionchus mayeri TaxID=1317129 RepID=A0AAN5DE39_9BILA|nr:hypothetical protein PMAYCL1PPCAC_31511 [Pristionchus mayeri]